jgi:hypothetical protein
MRGMSMTEPVSPAGGSAVPAAGGGAVTPAAEGPAGAGHLRAVFLGPRGGGTLRRRASDAFRLGFAAVVVAVSIPVMRANSAAEVAIVHALNPPPTAIRWLVTTLFWVGSVGVVAGLAVLALLVPRLAAVRRVAVAGLAAWAGGIADLGVSLTAIARAPGQVWGLEKFTGRDDDGAAVELSVYGRDAADARVLAKLWRFCFYRDSGATLILSRDLLVEHEAHMTLMAGRAGVPVPGGAGVVEAGLIAGLTSAGVPESQAVAAVFIQRLFAAYLPPVWGWVTLAWMRRREYV